jgi:hypothetical protein
LSADFETLFGILESIIFSLLLVVSAAERQLEYWTPDRRLELTSVLGNFKLILALLICFFVQQHPLFDDFKGLSGFSPAMASFLICTFCTCFLAAVYAFRIRSEMGKGVHELLLFFLVFNATLVLSFLLGYNTFLLLSLLFTTLPLTYFHLLNVGCVISQVDSMKVKWNHRFQEYSIIAASLGAFYLVTNFAGGTLADLSFKFHWGNRIFSLNSFSLLHGLLMAVAVAGPSLALPQQGSEQELGYVSGVKSSGGDGETALVDKLKTNVFLGSFQMISALVATVELVVREQDWADHGVKPGAVYPSYLLAATAGLLVATAHHLYDIGYLRCDATYTD